MRWETARAALVEHGWTVETLDSFSAASKHPSDDVRWFAMPPGRRGQRGWRHERSNPWQNRTASVEAWASTPDDKGKVTHLCVAFDSDGKWLRIEKPVYGWKPHPYTVADAASAARIYSVVGRAERAERQAAAEQAAAERRDKHEAEAEALRALFADARALLDDLGFDGRKLREDCSRSARADAALPIEDLLAVLRLAARNVGREVEL